MNIEPENISFINSSYNNTDLNWLFFDLDSYFATIEQQVIPEYRGKPIAVVTLMNNATCAIAASYEAKKYGIKTGTKIYEAKKLCPELICVQARPKIYTEFHKLIFTEVNKIMKIDHVLSIDEGACRLTGKQKNEEEAKILASRIKESIKQNVGDYITCSIGIASNMFLAKIASNIQKPNGTTVIEPSNIKKRLSALNLKDIPGIGHSMLLRLENKGINNVSQLLSLKDSQMQLLWNSVLGKRMWYLLQGYDIPLQETKHTTVGQSKMLPPISRPVHKSRDILVMLIQKAASRLREKDLYASKVNLHINTIDNKKYKTNIKFNPSCDNFNLMKAILICWDQLVSKHKIKFIRKISISFYNLSQESGQMNFDALMSNKLTKNVHNKKEIISRTLDVINKKFGSNFVSLGLVKLKKKEQSSIAFGHIPN
jgi:DNA polymerase-4